MEANVQPTGKMTLGVRFTQKEVRVLTVAAAAQGVTIFEFIHDAALAALPAEQEE